MLLRGALGAVLSSSLGIVVLEGPASGHTKTVDRASNAAVARRVTHPGTESDASSTSNFTVHRSGAYLYVASHSNAHAQSKSEGTVNRWGNYIGDGAADRESTPVGVSGLANVVEVQASNASDYALVCAGGKADCATDGVVYGWGNNGQGELGNSSGAGSSQTAEKIAIPTAANIGIVAIGEARNEGFAVASNGQAYGWGTDGNGSLCIGNTKNQVRPVAIPVTKAVAVQGGQNHVLFLLSNGTVVACGVNGYGQLGDGSKKGSSTPVAVTGLSNVTEISAGNLTSAALTASGQVYTWGDNDNGQLGTGSTAAYSKVPVLVGLPAVAKQVYVGGDVPTNGQDVALLNNGMVYSWGSNSFGQLGNGNTTSSNSPVLVHLPSGISASSVATGGETLYVLDAGGNLWGYGNYKYVGSGLRTDSLTASKIDSGVVQVSATANSTVDCR